MPHSMKFEIRSITLAMILLFSIFAFSPLVKAEEKAKEAPPAQTKAAAKAEAKALPAASPVGTKAEAKALPSPSPAKAETTQATKKKGFKNMYALFDTTMGNIKCRLFFDKVPNTVANFTDLAEGKKEWIDSSSRTKKKTHFFDGLVFHRVIPKFMIQGGDPLGNGTGGPGYQFKDEFASDLKHDKPGMLSMANSGKDTNGSQFFITSVATPWLDRKHTIFGEVIEGMDVVDAISNTPRDSSNDKPLKSVVINKLTIIRE